MALRENFNTVRTLTALAQAVRTASANGVTIDTAGFGSVGFIHTIGTQGVTLDGTNNITLQLQESDDGSTWTNVATADALCGTTTTTPAALLLNANGLANRVHRQDYIGAKRYVRVQNTFAGTHGTGTSTSTVALLGDAIVNPVAHAA